MEPFFRLPVLLAVLAAMVSCGTSDFAGADADATETVAGTDVPAEVVADAPAEVPADTCAGVPSSGMCCCDGDLAGTLICGDAKWECSAPTRLYLGAQCTDPNGPCSIAKPSEGLYADVPTEASNVPAEVVEATADPAADASGEAGSDAGPEATDDLTADASADIDPDTILCGVPYPLFPWFDKSCSSDGDCAIGLHMVNCCGGLSAIGFNASQKDSFAAAEAVCESQYPPCGCMAPPPTAEDGNVSANAGDIEVCCKSGACMTYITTLGPPFSRIPCGQGFCYPGDESCCVTPAGQSCTTPGACGTANFAVACDGPEDCGPNAACCMPSGVDFWNFCVSGPQCLALELKVCHVDGDCGDGNACCPASFKGWSYKACQSGGACH